MVRAPPPSSRRQIRNTTTISIAIPWLRHGETAHENPQVRESAITTSSDTTIQRRGVGWGHGEGEEGGGGGLCIPPLKNLEDIVRILIPRCRLAVRELPFGFR